MDRRDLLSTLGALTALSAVPGEAAEVWQRLSAGYRPTAGLAPAQLELVSVLADIIIPRTDTPGALDVGVPAWVDLVVAEYYSAADRAAFLSGLSAIDARARALRNVSFPELDAAARAEIMSALDRPADRQSPDARAYARLKGLVVHGYFTSERVQKDVLHTEIMPGRFEGAAPHPLTRSDA